MSNLQVYDWDNKEFIDLQNAKTIDCFILLSGDKVYFSPELKEKDVKQIVPWAKQYIRLKHIRYVSSRIIGYAKDPRKGAIFTDDAKYLNYVLQCSYLNEIFKLRHNDLTKIKYITYYPISFLAYNPKILKIFLESKANKWPKINHDLLLFMFDMPCEIKKENSLYIKITRESIDSDPNTSSFPLYSTGIRKTCYFQWMDPTVPFNPFPISLKQFISLLDQKASPTSYQILATMYQSAKEEIISRHGSLKALLQCEVR